MKIIVNNRAYTLNDKYVQISKELISKSLDKVEEFAASNLQHPEEFYFTYLLMMGVVGRNSLGGLTAKEIEAVFYS